MATFKSNEAVSYKKIIWKTDNGKKKEIKKETNNTDGQTDKVCYRADVIQWSIQNWKEIND